MSLTPRLVNAANVVLIVAGISLTASVVKREFFTGGSDARSGGRETRDIRNWREVAAVGHRRGRANSLVTIVEFADFQCPACRRFARESLRQIERVFGDTVALVFRHWPLPYHPFAYSAARAAECAGAQGRFDSAHDLLYQYQDSLGSKPFHEIARDAGVLDLSQFDKCMRGPERLPVIDADIGAARALGATGTPTIIVNGRLLGGPPDSTMLAAEIRRAITSIRR